jgi:hypothetical protein
VANSMLPFASSHFHGVPSAVLYRDKLQPLRSCAFTAFVSAATAWEFGIRSALKKPDFNGDLESPLPMRKRYDASVILLPKFESVSNL